MPTLSVLRRVDAYVDYVAQVEANSPEEAAELAMDNDGNLTWEEQGSNTFDARFFVTLGADGDDIDGTQCGDTC